MADDFNILDTPASSGGNGILLQQQSAFNGDLIEGNTAITSDDSIPQNTEGDELFTVNITPADVSNILIIECIINVGMNGHGILALFQDSISNALAASEHYQSQSNTVTNIALRHIMVAGTTSSTTFKIRFGRSGGGAFYLNGTLSGTGVRRLGGVMASGIVIKELSAI